MAKPSRRERKPSTELARFTDREEPRAAFQHYLNAGTEPPVLMFFGVGGAGKTWLLKKLREETPPGLPSALIDFDSRIGRQRFSLDPAQALHEIRQQLGQPAPRFDLAYAMRLFKQGAFHEPGFKGHGIAGSTIEVIAEIVAYLSVPGANVIINKLSAPARKILKGTPLEQFLATHLGSEFYALAQAAHDAGHRTKPFAAGRKLAVDQERERCRYQRLTHARSQRLGSGAYPN